MKLDVIKLDGGKGGSIELSDEIFAELRKIDTPTITNVVATYPKNPLCLGLYNPWTENWYTDSTIRCIYPEMGPIVGYAVTCVYGLPDPNFAGRLSFMDVIDALDANGDGELDPRELMGPPPGDEGSFAGGPPGGPRPGAGMAQRLFERLDKNDKDAAKIKKVLEENGAEVEVK